MTRLRTFRLWSKCISGAFQGERVHLLGLWLGCFASPPEVPVNGSVFLLFAARVFGGEQDKRNEWKQEE
jgi:hypothetical protein